MILMLYLFIDWLFNVFRNEMWRQTLSSSCSRSCCVFCCLSCKGWLITNSTRPNTSVAAFVPTHKGISVWRRRVGFSIRILTKLARVPLLTLLNGLLCCKCRLQNTALRERIFFPLTFQIPPAGPMARVRSLCSLPAITSLLDKVCMLNCWSFLKRVNPQLNHMKVIRCWQVDLWN